MIKSDTIGAAVALLDNPPAKRMCQQLYAEQSQGIVAAPTGYDFGRFYYREPMYPGPMISGYTGLHGGYAGMNWGLGNMNMATNDCLPSVYHPTGHWNPSTIQYY